MHPNENPSNVLATPLLSGPNYHSWSRAVTVALRSKHKMHFINGARDSLLHLDPLMMIETLLLGIVAIQ
jgi:hypothetical protein